MSQTACMICRGACCETIVMPPIPGDAGTWLALHGKALDGGRVELATPCRALGVCGMCGIYESRPQNCRDFAVGGPLCRDTVRRRRPEDAEQILKLIDAG
jgi:hypothetical protein